MNNNHIDPEYQPGHAHTVAMSSSLIESNALSPVPENHNETSLGVTDLIANLFVPNT